MKISTLAIALGVCIAAALAISGMGHALDLGPLVTKSALAGDTVLAMAVVAKYGTGSRDPSSFKAIDGIFAAAEIRCLNSQIAITNGDSIASTFRIGEVPADAILDFTSTIYYEAVAGVTSLDVGFRYPNGGAVIDADNLIAAKDISSAGNMLLSAGAVTTANQQKRVWEIAGLTSNPGGNLELYATLNAASTATKVVNFFLKYLKGA